MKLNNITTIEGKIVLVSGLHIGGGKDDIRIGGCDSPVIKHPYSQQPYVPGSSLKGRMRSLLEWRAGLVGISEGSPVNDKVLAKVAGEPNEAAAVAIAQLFGISGVANDKSLAARIGPTRVGFWDAELDAKWLADRKERNQQYTEEKSENSINRITGVADNPRWTERVPSGASFDLKLSLKLLDGDTDFVPWLLDGLRLLEMEGLGGSVSRGYGRFIVKDLCVDGESVQAGYEQRDPFSDAA